MFFNNNLTCEQVKNKAKPTNSPAILCANLVCKKIGSEGCDWTWSAVSESLEVATKAAAILATVLATEDGVSCDVIVVSVAIQWFGNLNKVFFGGPD